MSDFNDELVIRCGDTVYSPIVCSVLHPTISAKDEIVMHVDVIHSPPKYRGFANSTRHIMPWRMEHNHKTMSSGLHCTDVLAVEKEALPGAIATFFSSLKTPINITFPDKVHVTREPLKPNDNAHIDEA
ncbi:14kDa protein [Botrytis virus X]|uniref:Uncharacterized ORF5 protein n=1 Tax=Botrytis virus X (isolate Botrytis cinerea/New Zealand/Howitt/2006) TaxID=686947 RepID=ORF5_BOTVX|nr:14kDa protein [Botrytis virus X]Q6YNQ3.1 RecName: Full=Uncharacterized ORF5 protein [Botrytis virus X NZL/Howitt]AAL17726.1 14kDa protein [Botrytis virus X]